MKQQGIENLRAIFRRSRLIVLLLVVLGAIQMNIVRSQQGPLYNASANVILSPIDLATALAGLSSYVDPNRIDETEQALANSIQLFNYAASKHPGVGTGRDLKSSISVTKGATTISFSATRDNAAAAVADANAVANAYPDWRTSVSNASIDTAIAQLRAQIKKGSDADTVSQLNRLRLLKTLTSGNVLLVEKATRATKTRPRPVRDTLLGAFVGLFAALVVVGLREALDTRVRSEYEVEELLGIPVVGSVERLPRRATPLVIGNREYERYGDMYALVAASVARLREGADRTIIAITSATAGEGKTTTAVNLAAALARRNENVCLIDLDTRRPSVARVLRIPRDAHGVDRALLRNANVGTLLWDVNSNGSGLAARPATEHAGARTATVHSRLQVLPMGSDSIGSISPHGERLAGLIRDVSARSDYVVIDTPPALSVPDMTELAKLADIVLVVVRHGQASRRNLDALRRLHRTWPDVDIRGVVVDTPPDGDSYSYYAGS